MIYSMYGNDPECPCILFNSNLKIYLIYIFFSFQTEIISNLIKTEFNDSNYLTADYNLVNDENESFNIVTNIVEKILDCIFNKDQDDSLVDGAKDNSGNHSHEEQAHEKEHNISQISNLDDSNSLYNSEADQSLDAANSTHGDLDYYALENSFGHAVDDLIEPPLIKERNNCLEPNSSDTSNNINTSEDRNEIIESHAFDQSNKKNIDEDTFPNNSLTTDLTHNKISNPNICSLNKEPANEYEKDLSDLESFITSIPTVSVVDTAAFIVEELIDTLLYHVVSTVEDKAKEVNLIDNTTDGSNIIDSSMSDLDISSELFDNFDTYDPSADALKEMLEKYSKNKNTSESVIEPVPRTFSVITNHYASENYTTPKDSSGCVAVDKSIDIDDLLDGSDEDDYFR